MRIHNFFIIISRMISYMNVIRSISCIRNFAHNLFVYCRTYWIHLLPSVDEVCWSKSNCNMYQKFYFCHCGIVFHVPNPDVIWLHVVLKSYLQWFFFLRWFRTHSPSKWIKWTNSRSSELKANNRNIAQAYNFICQIYPFRLYVKKVRIFFSVILT